MLQLCLVVQRSEKKASIYQVSRVSVLQLQKEKCYDSNHDPSMPWTIALTALTVGRDFDFLGQLGDIDLESVLYVIQSFCIGFIRHKGDCQTFGTETTSPSDLTTETKWETQYHFINVQPYSVKVCIGVLWHVIVEHDIDTFNIHPSSEEVSRNQYSLLEILKPHNKHGYVIVNIYMTPTSQHQPWIVDNVADVPLGS